MYAGVTKYGIYIYMCVCVYTSQLWFESWHVHLSVRSVVDGTSNVKERIGEGRCIGVSYCMIGMAVTSSLGLPLLELVIPPLTGWVVQWLVSH